MALLTGEQILGADDLPYEDVPCPEWGGTVRVRLLSAREFRALAKKMGEISNGTDAEFDTRTLLVGACLVGEDGKQLFTPEQFAGLASKSQTVIVRLAAVCSRINCLGIEEDQAEKK